MSLHLSPQSNGERLRLNYEDLDIDWHYQQYLWQGRPFTGIAYEVDPDGTVVAETEFEDGFARASRTWYGSGRPRSEWRVGPSGPNGPAREWYPDGRLQSDYLYEHGILLRQKTWDSQGNLIKNYTLRETDPDYVTLTGRRRIEAGLDVT